MINRSVWLVSLTVILIISGALFCVFVNGDTITPYNNQDMMPVIKEGIKNNVSAVKNGRGGIIVNTCVAEEDSGNVLEIETRYKTAFAETNFMFSTDERVVRNDTSPGRDMKMLPFGSGYTEAKEFSYDGNSLSIYDASKHRLHIRDSRTCGSEMNKCRLDTSFIGPLVVRLQNALDSKDGSARIVGREIVDGDECFIIEIESKQTLSAGSECVNDDLYWVNPSKGFTLPKIEYWGQGGVYKEKTLLSEIRTQVRDYGKNIWGPEKIKYTEYRIGNNTGKLYKELEKTIVYQSDYVINSDVEPMDLKIKAPSGTRVHDEIADMEYTLP